MSSTLLYLAIVAVWAVVLVPMWLHRDTDTTTGISRLLNRRPQPASEYDDLTVEEDTEEFVPLILTEAPPAPHPGPRTGRGTRAAIIARRRRRTSGLTLLTITATVVTILGLAPWWIAIPPVILLLSHLTLLRTATKIDAQRREEARQSRQESRREARAAAERLAEELANTRLAEVIAFTARTSIVFDQYADEDTTTTTTQRAVGD